MGGRMRRDPPQPALIANPLGENLTVANVVEASLALSEGMEQVAQVQPQVDALLDCFARLGKIGEGSERLLEARDGFPVGRARGGLRPGLTEIGDGLVPDLAPESMVGESIDLLGQPGGIELFDRRHDASVKRAPSVLEE